MNKKSTLIYQFNSLNINSTIIFDLQELLIEEEKLRQKLKDLKRIKLKSPEIRVLQKN